MLAIMQDFKDWKTAKNNVVAVKALLRGMCNLITTECKAYPCFYNGETKNYIEDTKSYETFCSNCAKFKTLVQLQTAHQKQQEAKQKFLSNFIFWKQNSK